MKRLQIMGMVAMMVAAGITASASAQQEAGERSRVRIGGSAGLLMNKAVQKELNITPEQKQKLEALQEDSDDAKNLTPKEQRKLSREKIKKAEETIKTMLDEKQQTRLAEIRIQLAGASAITRHDVAMKLGLDQKQKDLIQKIQTKYKPSARLDIQNATPEEVKKFRAEARLRRDKISMGILSVLTKEQKENFKKMQGEKFTLRRAGKQSQ